MKRLLIVLLLAFSVQVMAKDMPYSATADANADVQQALARAKTNHLPVLIFFGANWCEDCRSLARSLKQPGNAELMAKSFNVVKVDVGNFDRNLDVAKQFGDPIEKGIPAAVMVSPNDTLLYSTKAGELANARQMSASGVHDFFEQAKIKAESKH